MKLVPKFLGLKALSSEKGVYSFKIALSVLIRTVIVSGSIPFGSTGLGWISLRSIPPVFGLGKLYGRSNRERVFFPHTTKTYKTNKIKQVLYIGPIQLGQRTV